MPEIPDVEVFCSNLKTRFAGQKLRKIKVVNGKKFKDKPADLVRMLEGKTLKDVYRSGKELRFKFSGNVTLGIHLMLTGDIIPFTGKNVRKSTLIEFYFRDEAMALTDRMKNAYVKLDPKEKEGIDAMDKNLNFAYLKKLFQKKAQVKNLLTNQQLIRGIGNGYSDEILWKTRISPFSIASAIPDKKIRELARNIKKVLKEATAKIRKNHPGLVYGEVKDYLKIHTKKKKESPTGHLIKMANKGMSHTFYTDEQILYK